jgi:hypothetical protein
MLNDHKARPTFEELRGMFELAILEEGSETLA